MPLYLPFHMRYLLFFIVNLPLLGLGRPAPAVAQAPARTYYTALGQRTTVPDSAAYYTVVHRQGAGGYSTTYQRSGRPLHQERYDQLRAGRRHGASTECAGTGRRAARYPYQQGQLHGLAQVWYPSGRPRWQLMYWRGQRHGTLRAWHPSGRLMRTDTYRAGVRIAGHCYTRAGHDTAWFAFERPARFVGGPAALQRWLSTNLRYPALALRNQVEGDVGARFVVDAQGRIADITILKSLGVGTTEEVMRLLGRMPAWEPAVVAGQPVAVSFELPIAFRIR